MSQNIPFENGTLTLTPLQDNAVRIRYSEGEIKEMLEDTALSDIGRSRTRIHRSALVDIRCRRILPSVRPVFE